MARCMDCKHEECRCCDAPIQKAFDQFAELVKIDPLPPDPDPEKRLVFMKLAELRNMLREAFDAGNNYWKHSFEEWLEKQEGKYAALKV